MIYSGTDADAIISSLSNIHKTGNNFENPGEAAFLVKIMNSFRAEAEPTAAVKPPSRYKYVGMDDTEVENMVLEKLPENMTLENAWLYLAIYRKIHEILDAAANVGESAARGADKLAYVLDWLESNPGKKMTVETLISGAKALEILAAEASGNYNSHLHDLAGLCGLDTDNDIDNLLTYYLLIGDKFHMGKYFDLQGELAAAEIIKEVMQKHV